MEIDLPSGCNVYYGTYIDNYVGSTRRRYYIDHYNLILSTTTNNSSQPSGTTCFTGKLLYKPEVAVEFQVISFGLIVVAALLIFNLIIKKLWQS